MVEDDRKTGDRRDVSYKIAQSAEGATQPSPDREVGESDEYDGEPRRARHNQTTPHRKQHLENPGDRRDVSSNIAQSAEGATQPSPDRKVGESDEYDGEPRRARHSLSLLSCYFVHARGIQTTLSQCGKRSHRIGPGLILSPAIRNPWPTNHCRSAVGKCSRRIIARSTAKRIVRLNTHGASNFLKGRRMLRQDHYLAIRQFVSTSLQDAIRQSLCHDYVFLGVKLIVLKKSRKVESIAER
jgi:hypothetical protein